jgi:hypothetical protein
VESGEIKLYPNPSSTGSFYLEVDNNLIKSVMIIFDERGRQVYEFQILSEKSKIDLDVESGIYFLQISNSQNSIKRKLLKL